MLLRSDHFREFDNALYFSTAETIGISSMHMPELQIPLPNLQCFDSIKGYLKH